MKTKALLVMLVSPVLWACSNNDFVDNTTFYPDNQTNLYDVSSTVTKIKMLNPQSEILSENRQQAIWDELQNEALQATENDTDNFLEENLLAITKLPMSIKTYTTQKYFQINNSDYRIKVSSNDFQKFYINKADSFGNAYRIYAVSNFSAPLSIVEGVKNNEYRVMLSYGGLCNTWKIKKGIKFGNVEFIGSDFKNGTLGNNFQYALDNKNDFIGVSPYLGTPINNFSLMPDAEFELKNIKFITDNGVIVDKSTTFSLTASVVNESRQWKRRELKVDTIIGLRQTFVELKDINIKVAEPNLMITLPTIIKNQVNFENSTNIVRYIPNSIYLLNTEFSQKMPVNVRPRTKLTMKCNIDVYNIKLRYVATIAYKDRETKFKGWWDGQVCVISDEEPDFIETNLDTNESKIMKMNINSYK